MDEMRIVSLMALESPLSQTSGRVCEGLLLSELTWEDPPYMWTTLSRGLGSWTE